MVAPRPKGRMRKSPSELCLQGKLRQGEQTVIGSSWYCSLSRTEQVVGVCAQIRRK